MAESTQTYEPPRLRRLSPIDPDDRAKIEKLADEALRDYQYARNEYFSGWGLSPDEYWNRLHLLQAWLEQ